MTQPILPPPMHPAATVASDEPDAALLLSTVLTDLDAELASACVLHGYRVLWPEVLRDVASRIDDERERETITDAIRAWGMRRDARCVALCDEVYAARGGL